MVRETRTVGSFSELKDRLDLNDKEGGARKKTVTVRRKGGQAEGQSQEWEIELPDDSRHELAYREACENRRFEIQMYWHRAAYFWAFIAAIYTALFFISGKDGDGAEFGQVIKLALSFLGFAFCTGFYFANRGSKVWQENWEIHEGLLEDKVAVRLYKTFHFDRKNDYSVSKINDWLCGILSLFSFGFFCATLVLSIQKWFGRFPFAVKFFLFALSVFAVLLLLHIAKKSVRGNKSGAKTAEFKRADYHE